LVVTVAWWDFLCGSTQTRFEKVAASEKALPSNVYQHGKMEFLTVLTSAATGIGRAFQSALGEFCGLAKTIAGVCLTLPTGLEHAAAEDLCRR